MLSDLRPVVLRGKQVYLEPLEERHAAELFAIGRDERIWRYFPRCPITSEEDAQRFIEQAMLSRAFGNELQFAIRACATDALIGATRYQDIQPRHESVEVGWTFVHPGHWFRGAGTESTLLLVQHAIEDLGAGRVWCKTDARNLRTQRVLEKCGAHREGVLRRHLRSRDGLIRDSVIYSVLPEEWPALKQRTEKILARLWASSSRTSRYSLERSNSK
jgi:RimJ/RimL family protein N-acetyltransferase